MDEELIVLFQEECYLDAQFLSRNANHLNESSEFGIAQEWRIVFLDD